MHHIACRWLRSVGVPTAATLPRGVLTRRAQAERARQAEAAAQAEVGRLEGLLREVRGRVEQRRGDLSSQQSQGAVVKALLEARSRGEIQGIHGRLGAWPSGAGGGARGWGSCVSACCLCPACVACHGVPNSWQLPAAPTCALHVHFYAAPS